MRIRIAVLVALMGSLIFIGGPGAAPANASCPEYIFYEDWFREEANESCDSSGVYWGRVQDGPVADGVCTSIWVLDDNWEWYNQAWACNSTWVYYGFYDQTSNTSAIAHQACHGWGSCVDPGNSFYDY
jgi:hypothetical protein